jgi:hypothetical protein
MDRVIQIENGLFLDVRCRARAQCLRLVCKYVSAHLGPNLPKYGNTYG